MFATCKAVGGKHFTIAGDDSTGTFTMRLDTPTRRTWAMEWIEAIPDPKWSMLTHLCATLWLMLSRVCLELNIPKTLSDLQSRYKNNVIREALKQYTIDGNMGHLLDAVEDVLIFLIS